MLEAKKRLKKNIIMDEETVSSESEEENEMTKQVQMINNIAKEIIRRTRQQYIEGVQMNKFYPLTGDEFENTDTIMLPTKNYQNTEGKGMSILKREHYCHLQTNV